MVRNVSPGSGPPFATWKSVLVLYDDGSHRIGEYAEVERRFCAHASLHRGTAGVMVVIPSHAKPPADEVRRSISNAFDRLSPKLDGVVWVVEGSGFVSAIARAALTTINLASRRAYPRRVATNVTDGLGWLLEKRATVGAVDFASGVAAVDAIRPTSGSRIAKSA